MSAVIAHCSCPDAETAARVARALVEERLAACVQIIDGVASTYRWEGRVMSEAEALLLIKTTKARVAALKTRLAALHPYATPELIVFDAIDGLPSYLDWIEAQTASE